MFLACLHCRGFGPHNYFLKGDRFLSILGNLERSQLIGSRWRLSQFLRRVRRTLDWHKHVSVTSVPGEIMGKIILGGVEGLPGPHSHQSQPAQLQEGKALLVTLISCSRVTPLAEQGKPADGTFLDLSRVWYHLSQDPSEQNAPASSWINTSWDGWAAGSWSGTKGDTD